MAELKGRGAPTDRTVGAAGDIYVNELSGVKYKCTGVVGVYAYGDDNVTYCWSVVPANESTGVSSWNDLTDKPFGMEPGYDLIPETSPAFIAGHWDYTPDQFIRFEPGVEYTLSLDGTNLRGVAELLPYLSPERSIIPFNYGGSNLTVSETLDTESYHISGPGNMSSVILIRLWKSDVVVPLDPTYLPKATAVSDLTEAPSAENFNALLASLRAAGYLAE